MEETKYLIVGGGLAGLNSLAAIRERDSEGRIIMVADEKHLPYDRVPLSKGYFLDKIDRAHLFPKKDEVFKEKNVELWAGTRAISLDVASRSVELQDGLRIAFERLLLATGGKPTKLPIAGADLNGVHYFRTLDDCDDVKSELSRPRGVVIVGGGFIGCELAAACIARGHEVTLVEAFPRILSLAFDPETSEWIEGHLKQRGFKIMTNAPAAEFVGEDGLVTGVKTKNGDLVTGDLVLVGIGLKPCTELAEGTALKTENGFVVDEYLETSEKGIFAAGDVARFFHPAYGHSMRVEHYDVAVKHGMVAGANMAGDRMAFTEPPHFFSFLPDLTINAYGDTSARERIVRRGELGVGGFFQFYFAEEKLRALLSVNRPFSEIKTARAILAKGPSFDALHTLSDPGQPLGQFAS